MTFLNVFLLAGAIAASIPLFLHLLNRRRFRRVQWGAMHFLQDVVRSSHRRLRLEQIVLLIIRGAIPLFLALCMARPVITGANRLVHNAKSSLVVLLDNSLSMEAGRTTESNFEAAKETADRIIDRLPRGSEVAILGLAGPMPTLADPSLNMDKTRKQVAAQTGGFGLARVSETIETASGVFAARMHQADRELAIISDFQRVNWDEVDGKNRARALQILAAQPVPPRIVLLPVGAPAMDNVAVESIDMSHTVAAVQQKLMLRANVRNLGHTDHPDLRVYFRADGTERAVSQISLPAGEQRQILFTHAFETAGSHLVEVQVDADRLKTDNVNSRSMLVFERLPVLIISGDVQPTPLRGESAFVEIALQPFATAGLDRPDLIAPRVVSETQFTPADLEAARVVVLTNVRQLDDTQRNALQTFVEEGGGLLVFPGDRVNADWYDAKAFSAGRGLLPYRLGALSGNLDANAEPAGIVAQHFEHQALAPFNDPRSGSLQGAQIRVYYRLTPPDETIIGRQPPQTLAQLDNGDPFLVEGAYGEGRVLLCATAADADWSNLPMRTFYLPFVQQLVVYLASKVYPARNVEVDDRLAAFLPLATVGQSAELTSPDGQKHAVPITKQNLHGLAEYTGTQRPGLYLLRTPAGETIHFVVSSPPAESQLDRLDEKELAALAIEMHATLAPSAEAYRTQTEHRRFGREIWSWIAGVVLVLLFLEMFFVQHVGRRGA